MRVRQCHNKKLNRRQTILAKTDGFTLVELIVTMTILVMVASFGIWSIMGWTNNTEFRRQNEYAQTLFVAAQNQLTEYNENGQLEILAEELKKDSSLLFTAEQMSGMTDEDGNPLQYQENLIHITVSKADYTQYKNGTLSEPSKQAVYDILSRYTYQQNILEASISLEFSLKDGQVYSVLYSDRDNAFTYGENSDSSQKVVSVKNRTTSNRRENLIGYYGVSTLAKAEEDGEQKVLSLEKVKLHNEETLSLTFSLKDEKALTGTLLYEIHVKEKSSKDDAVKIWIDGTKLKAKEAALLENAMTCKVEILSEVSAQNQAKEMPIMAWIEEDESVRVILDAADLQATIDSWNRLEKKTDDVFADTMSFHRFGVESDEIYCTVKASGELYQTSGTKESNVANAYFASHESVTEEEETKDTYEISNFRHFYNIRYVEDREDSVLSNRSCVYQVNADLDWKAFVEGGSLYNRRKTESYQEETGELPEFPSLIRMRASSVLTSKSEENTSHIIKNLNLKETSNLAFGIYRHSLIKALEENDTNEDYAEELAAAKTPSALVLFNQGSISNLNLQDSFVQGRNHTGSFVGYQAENASLVNCHTLDSQVQSGRGMAGGLVGDNHGLIENCDFNGAVSGSGSAEQYSVLGGVVGRNAATGEIKNSTIALQKETNILNDRNDGNTACGYVGGVAGINAGVIEAYDNQKAEKFAVRIQNGAGSTGGIVGYHVEEATLSGKNAENQLTTAKNWTITQREFEATLKNGCGGIIGYNENSRPLEYVQNFASITMETSQTEVPLGGIIGNSQNTSALALNYCVNYGNLRSHSARNLSGIIGMGTADNGANITLYRCRNYGNSDNKNFCGIAKQNYGDMTDCFSFSNNGTGVFRLVDTEKEARGNVSDNFFLYYDRADVDLSENGTALMVTEETTDNSAFQLETEEQIEEVNLYFKNLKYNPMRAITQGSENMAGDSGKTVREQIYEELDQRVLQYYAHKTGRELPATEEEENTEAEEETDATEEIDATEETTENREASEEQQSRQLEAVQISESQSVEKYEKLTANSSYSWTGFHKNTGSSASGTELQVTQTMLNYSFEKEAEGMLISIVHMPEIYRGECEALGGFSRYKTSEIRIVRDTDADGNDLTNSYSVYNGDSSQKIGKLNGNYSALELRQSDEISLTVADKEETIQPAMYLYLSTENGESVLHIVLPDIESYNQVRTDSSGYLTSQVMVQAIAVREKSKSWKKDSKLQNWYRIMNGAEAKGTNTILLSEREQAADLTKNITLSASEEEEIDMMISTAAKSESGRQNWIEMQLQCGTTTRTYALYGKKNGQSQDILPFSSLEYNLYEGRQVKIRYRSISVGTNGKESYGISAWSNWSDLQFSERISQ